jgi:hypothetical protein
MPSETTSAYIHREDRESPCAYRDVLEERIGILENGLRLIQGKGGDAAQIATSALRDATTEGGEMKAPEEAEMSILVSQLEGIAQRIRREPTQIEDARVCDRAAAALELAEAALAKPGTGEQIRLKALLAIRDTKEG